MLLAAMQLFSINIRNYKALCSVFHTSIFGTCVPHDLHGVQRRHEILYSRVFLGYKD